MRNLLLLLLVFIISTSFSQTTSTSISLIENKISLLDQEKEKLFTQLEDLKLEQLRYDLYTIGLPKLKKDETLINHTAMSLVYNEFHEQAKWVAHIITPDVINGKSGRSNDFREDELIATGSATERDYFTKTLKTDSTYEYDGFGYDRGHLAPSADFRWSSKALSESYLYSNMSPQLAEFNREKWADLEGLLRGYIYSNPSSQLYIVTGPILRKNLPHIEKGYNKVSIPDQFFKVVLDFNNKRAIGFLMPNKKIHYPVSSYAKSIDEIETLSGIDFYHMLDDAIEDSLEKQFNISEWIPKNSKTDVNPIYAPDLPQDVFNSVQAKIYVDEPKEVDVCGTVVNAKISRNGHIFMNIDKNFPNQIFSVAIWKKNHPNFSYNIETEWLGKQVCFKGKIINFGGTPTMVIEKESQVKLYTSIEEE
jgi:endonuclease G